MASEKRLIDANALLKAIDKSDRDNFHNGVANRSCHHYEHVHFMKMVLNAPTVDAVEVVHGRWVDRYGGKYANPAYDCSECKKSALFRNDMDLLGNWKSVQYLSPYCPNCGAKMDGDGNG